MELYHELSYSISYSWYIFSYSLVYTSIPHLIRGYCLVKYISRSHFYKTGYATAWIKHISLLNLTFFPYLRKPANTITGSKLSKISDLSTTIYKVCISYFYAVTNLCTVTYFILCSESCTVWYTCLSITV